MINALQIHYALAFFEYQCNDHDYRDGLKNGHIYQENQASCTGTKLILPKGGYLVAQPRDQRNIAQQCYKGGDWRDRLIATISLRFSEQRQITHCLHPIDSIILGNMQGQFWQCQNFQTV